MPQPSADFLQWPHLAAAVVTERAIWTPEGPIVAISCPGLGMSDKELAQDPIDPKHLLGIRVVMAKTLETAYRWGIALIELRTVN